MNSKNNWLPKSQSVKRWMTGVIASNDIATTEIEIATIIAADIIMTITKPTSTIETDTNVLAALNKAPEMDIGRSTAIVEKKAQIEVPHGRILPEVAMPG